MYLDHAEEMANSKIPMYMIDWNKLLEEFLRFNRKDILNGSGRISHTIAVQKAEKEYDKFDLKRIDILVEIPSIEEE